MPARVCLRGYESQAHHMLNFGIQHEKHRLTACSVVVCEFDAATVCTALAIASLPAGKQANKVRSQCMPVTDMKIVRQVASVFGPLAVLDLLGTLCALGHPKVTLARSVRVV